MSDPTYRVRVDWGGAGDFSNASADVTDVVQVGRVQRKMGDDGICEGTLDLTLTDSWPGKYNAKNPASPLFGLIEPGLLCDVALSFDAGATWEPIYGGWFSESESDPDYGTNVARLSFTDMAYLDRRLDAIPSTGPTTVNAALDLIHDAIGWTGARDFNSDTPLADFSVDGNGTARDAVASIIKVDLGYYYVSRDFAATYVDRFEYARRDSGVTVEAMGASVPGVSIATVANRATATGPSGTPQQYEDATSRGKYGPLPDQNGDVQSDFFLSDAAALGNSQWRVMTKKDPTSPYWQFQPLPSDDDAFVVEADSLTVTGNEITDALRDAQGPVDGHFSGEGVGSGIFSAHTNKALDTAMSSLAGYNWGVPAGAVASIDAVTPNPFPAHKWLKVDATAAASAWATTNTAAKWPAAASGQAWRLSCWVLGPAGHTGKLAIQGFNASIVQVEEHDGPNFVYTGEPQRVTFTAVLNNAATVNIRPVIFGTAGDVFWVTALMLSQTAIDVPYVANTSTTAGSSATRGNARVLRGALGLFDETSGVMVVRARTTWDSAAAPVITPGFFYWANDGTHRIGFWYSNVGLYEIQRANGAADTLVLAGAFSAGEPLTIIGMWDAGRLYLSVNGAPFASVASANIPALTAQLEVGTLAGGSALSGDVAFAIAMNPDSPLTDADAAAIAALDDDVDATALALAHPDWKITGVWDGLGAGFDDVTRSGESQLEAAAKTDILDLVTVAPVGLPSEDQQALWITHDFGGGTKHQVTWRLRELPAVRPFLVGRSLVAGPDVVVPG